MNDISIKYPKNQWNRIVVVFKSNKYKLTFESRFEAIKRIIIISYLILNMKYNESLLGLHFKPYNRLFSYNSWEVNKLKHLYLTKGTWTSFIWYILPNAYEPVVRHHLCLVRRPIALYCLSGQSRLLNCGPLLKQSLS